MKILSITTSSDVCSVAILENTSILSELTLQTQKTHSESLMPTVKTVLEKANLKLEDIDYYAVDIGPRFFYWN